MNNKVYTYDGTYPSLISLICYLFHNNIKPDDIREEGYNPTLFETTIDLHIEKNEKDIIYILKKYGTHINYLIFKVFLSHDSKRELVIYYFLLNANKYGANVINMRNLRCVCKTLELARYVNNEAHKLKGFVRFQELANHILYAKISPVNDVLPLLSEHFKKRLNSEYWVIDDEGRSLVSIYDKKNYYIIEKSELKMDLENISDDENEISAMWCSFYETIGIKERENHRCRMNFMPKRYWKYMTEMSDECEKGN